LGGETTGDPHAGDHLGGLDPRLVPPHHLPRGRGRRASQTRPGRARRAPVSAYGGRPIVAGTVRIGDTTPGSTRPSDRLWQRLYLRPLPHQHGSLAWGNTTGAWESVCIGSQDRARPRRRAAVSDARPIIG